MWVDDDAVNFNTILIFLGFDPQAETCRIYKKTAFPFVSRPTEKLLQSG